MDRSKGDLRSFTVSTNRKPRNASQMVVTTGASSAKTPATSKVPAARKNATAMNSTMGS